MEQIMKDKIKYKSKEEIENVAFRVLRKLNNKSLLNNKNVEVYAFDDAFEITTDLNKYSDTIHYDSETNEWMLIQINEGKHRITNRSRSVYSERTMKYYSGYIYDRLNVFISE